MQQIKYLFGLIVIATSIVLPLSFYAGSAEAETISNWQKISHEAYTFSIPEKWQKDADTDIWAPKDKILNMGRPKTSLHVGGIPPMPGKSIDELLAFYYGSTPKISGKIKKCGMDGFFVEIDTLGYKHLGLILVQDLGMMKLLKFFDCQAPTAEFSKRQKIFKKILDSVACD